MRLSGEFLPVDYGPRGKGFQSIVRRFPIGPVSMVSPWNFPLNLVAHKVRVKCFVVNLYPFSWPNNFVQAVGCFLKVLNVAH